MTKTVTGLIIAVLLGCIGVPMLIISAILGGSGGCTPAIPNISGQPGIVSGDPTQIANATANTHVEVTNRIARWGLVVAPATTILDSQLNSLPYLRENNDHDSIGEFQQRTGQGWGNPQRLAHPAYQADRFYDKLLTVPVRQKMPLSPATQGVQVSAYPLEHAKPPGDAVQRAAANGWPMHNNIEQCAIGEWTQPVAAPIVSGFRTAQRPNHLGVDLGADRGTPIMAASFGEVIQVRCNSIDRRDGSDWGCNRDGDPHLTAGCGHYVEIHHPGDVMTRYCHMNTPPDVRIGDKVVTGQPIGIVGSTGHSSGPHLHFEIWNNSNLNGDGGTPVDPVPYMQIRSAPLDETG